eukprot:CAMPEP_0194265726 /NCGR_PEP_ID=MMETSP0169-20130528/863_1 /TAXON_ID=218684 /ORGANISM="Corethron pennatum, Strain L29A3" /LENGTH=445 /DNA_ID=CAMNT_0039006247 /DNA_START=168 /DNA_END=1504 /DNA_ORIENTATION=+
MVAIRKASVALAFAPPPGDLHRGIRHSRPLPRAFPCFQRFPLLCSGLFACGGSFRIGGRANHSDSKTTLRATIPSEISDGEVTVKTDDIFDPSADEINGSNDDNAISTSDNLYDPPNDDDLDLDFDSCVIPENLDVFSYKDCSDEANRSAKSLYGESTGGTEVDLNRNIDLGLKAIPLLAPIVAFLTYGSVAKLYTAVLDYIYSYRAFTSVDGGAYEIQIITPAVNGIVLPTMTILFATLTSNTVADLRQRQLDIRTCLNTEAGELRVLSSLVDVYENKEMAGICRMYLKQYTSRLIAESQPGMDVNQFESRGSMDSEMNGFVYQLNLALSRENESRVSPDLITESYGGGSSAQFRAGNADIGASVNLPGAALRYTGAAGGFDRHPIFVRDEPGHHTVSECNTDSGAVDNVDWDVRVPGRCALRPCKSVPWILSDRSDYCPAVPN